MVIHRRKLKSLLEKLSRLDVPKCILVGAHILLVDFWGCMRALQPPADTISSFFCPSFSFFFCC